MTHKRTTTALMILALATLAILAGCSRRLDIPPPAAEACSLTIHTGRLSGGCWGSGCVDPELYIKVTNASQKAFETKSLRTTSPKWQAVFLIPLEGDLQIQMLDRSSPGEELANWNLEWTGADVSPGSIILASQARSYNASVSLSVDCGPGK